MADEDCKYRTVVAAHRGGALLWAENSMKAFRGAVGLGVEQIETDLHLSADDEPVIIHDATLDRTTEASGAVREMDWETLRTIAIKGDDAGTIPHLDDVSRLLQATDITLRLELKSDASRRRYPGIADIAIAHLKAAGMLERTIFTAFDWDYLREVRDIVPEAPFIGLVNAGRYRVLGGLDGVLAVAEVDGVSEIAFPVDLLKDGAVSRAAARGIALGVYAVKSEAQTRRALAEGVRAFTTDLPDLALELRKEICR
ncbi:MAG: hypothetical protein RLZ98_2860 [Pseudomonadota bacterium]|jgi:glycerophosphoryl diester phosphodiesterase